MRAFFRIVRPLHVTFGAREFGLVLSFVVLALLQMRGFADDPGVGWHLKTGEWIVGHKSVPTTDPFLFSSEPREWRADQWLSDVFTIVMYERGSWVFLYAVFTAIFLFTFWGPLYTFVIRRKVSCLAALVSIFLAQKLASIHFILRPVLFSFLLFSVVLVLLVRAYEGACKSESRSNGLVLVFGALFVLWANIHPSFLLGLVMVAAAAITYPFECIRSGERVRATRFFGMVEILGVAGLGTLINPYGIGIYQTHIDHARRGGGTSEWLPLALTSVEGTLFLGVLSVIGVGFFVSGCSKENGKHEYEMQLLFDNGEVDKDEGIVSEKKLKESNGNAIYTTVFNDFYLLKVNEKLIGSVSRINVIGKSGDIYFEGAYTRKGRAYIVENGYFEFIWRDEYGNPVNNEILTGKWTLKRK